MTADSALSNSIRGAHVLTRALLILGVMLYALLSQAAADELVVQGEYLIQRRPARPGDQQAIRQKQYAVQSASKYFEVVSVGTQVRSKATSSRLVPLERSLVERDCASIRSDLTVRTCEPNVVRHLLATPNDTNFASQWALNNAVQSDINAPEAWNIGTGTK